MDIVGKYSLEYCEFMQTNQTVKISPIQASSDQKQPKTTYIQKKYYVPLIKSSKKTN